MSKSYPMVHTGIIGALEDFKARCDRAILAPVLFVESIKVERKGGLWFWRAGRFGGSVYVKKAPARGYVTREEKPTKQLLLEGPSLERMRLATRN